MNRRTFLSSAAAATTLAAFSPRAFAADKPNSNFHGVRVGCITYSFRGELKTAEEILKALVQLGISEVELMGDAIQPYAGIRVGGGRRRGEEAQPVEKPTDAQREGQLDRKSVV